jgi:hypothetical protein
MTKRSNRLRLVVKQSGKTAKDIINSFDEMEKRDRNGTLKLPKDPITISRHINAKRSFDIDMAVAYGKALDRDPADICFEPVYKTIWGEINPNDGLIKWFVDEQGEQDENLVVVRVPREFYSPQYRLLDVRNLQSAAHNTILIYKRVGDSGNFVNRKYFNSMCIIQYTDFNNKKYWTNGIPIPVSKNKFIIQNILTSSVIKDVKVHKIYPVVSAIHPAFYDDYTEI